MIALLFPLTFFVALLLIWFFFRSGGYKRRPLDSPPGADWSFSGERFVDPSSGETLEVWCHPKDGQRLYVRTLSRRRP